MPEQVECPRCGRPVVVSGEGATPSRPFCSPRCRLSDLGRWFEERHRLSQPLSMPVGDLANADDEDR